MTTTTDARTHSSLGYLPPAEFAARREQADDRGDLVIHPIEVAAAPGRIFLSVQHGGFRPGGGAGKTDPFDCRPLFQLTGTANLTEGLYK